MTTIRIGSFGVVALLACACLLSGCAFGTRSARFVYPPTETTDVAAPESEAGTVSLAVADGRTGERMIVGHVRNGFWMQTADVVVEQSAADWVKGALERELKNAGVRVVPEQEGAPRLTARVVRIECDAYFTYGGNVDLATDLTVAGRPVESQVHSGEGGARMNWGATEDSYSQSMALALQDAARKVAQAVRAALKPPTP